MERYDYELNVESDIYGYITENYDSESLPSEEDLYEEMWTSDHVTGNGSGSYTFSTWEAEENLCHNMDLLEEACDEFGCGLEQLGKGAEACDVTIRCYLLGRLLNKVYETVKDEWGLI